MLRCSRLIFYLLILSLSFIACDEKGQALFTKVSSSSSNIDFRNLLIEDESFNVLNYPYFYNGAGVAVGDINNDGLPDIFFTGNMVKNRLYINKGELEFEDITVKSTVSEKQGWCTGATMADVNADGWLDIYICRSADGDPKKRQNLLYINNHDNTFSEQAAKYGIADEGYSTQAAFFDYDKDNDLDLVVINHSSKEYMQGQQEKPGIRKQTNPDFSTHLYRNDGNSFKDVTEQSGITSNVLTFGLGLAVSDLNNDSWPDLYISNDFNEADYCFINQKDGTFAEKSAELFAYTSLFSMGNDAADINNDGYADIITLDMLPEGNFLQKMHNGSENFDKFQILFNNGFLRQYSRNMLQLNRGDGSFDEIGQFAGISNTDWSWAPLAADFNNDGHKDLFVSNGYVKDYTDMDYIKYNVDIIMERDPAKQQQMMKSRMDKLPTIKIPNYVFSNDGNLKFSNRTKDWGLDEPSITAGAAYADFDNDGDLDLVTSNCNDYATVYRNNLNTSDQSQNYLKIKLKGNGNNPFAVGSRVTLISDSGIQMQELMPSRGFQSSVDYILHFGVHKGDSITQVRVQWPTGVTSVVDHPGTNKMLELTINNAQQDSLQDVPPPAGTLFTFMDTLPFRHKESRFNDFSQQTLLPQWFSRQGPALAKGDLNGDGRIDLYIGGAKDQPGAIFLQGRDGSYRKHPAGSINSDSSYEDQTAVIFDADGDGDNDLFVGSGGYELAANDPLLQNRLYLNDGRANFSKPAGLLPQDIINDFTVSIIDINNDGLPDIFNGGFCVPGKYPQSTGSQLLINKGNGRYANETALLKGFDQSKLITSSATVDINKDGKKDLVVAGHWMSIEVWVNRNGALERDTSLISFNRSGLFNTVEAADIDNDGDEDLVAGNQGLNTQFVVTEKEPMEMFYADFDGNGTSEPVISYYIGGKRWPIYSRDDLVQQIPLFNKRYLYYSDYAKSTMEDIFGDKLNTASHYQASEMRSLILENTGKALRVKPLPKEAQWYPIYAIIVNDLNGDNKSDFVVAGNESYARIKFGAYSAGRGDVFINRGEQFERVVSNRSGLRISGDVRKMVLANDQLIFGINNQHPLCFTLSKN